MATAPMSSPQDPNAAPDDGSEDSAPDMSQGYTIEIKVGPGNKVISVDVEAASEEASEEGAGDSGAAGGSDPTEGADSEGTQVSSWKDAMQVAGDIYRNAGQASGGDQALRKQFYDQGPV